MDQKGFGKIVKKAATAPLIDLPKHQLWYVPILKGKMGEFGALKETDNEIRSKMTPLIEIPPVPWDYSKDEPAKTINNHVKGILKRLIESVGNSYPIYIDVELVEEIIKGSTYTIDFVLKELHSKGIEAIPVVRLSNSTPFLDAVKANIANVGRVCLRLNQDQLNEYNLATDVPELIKSLGINYKDTDLVMDFGYLSPEQEAMFTTFSKMTIDAFPNIEKFASIVVAMTSFPENLANQDAASAVKVPRSEWNIWKELYGMGSIKRKPVYGDYGISNPIMAEIDPRIMQMSANIRYTTSNDWYIIKGRGVKNRGFEQFYKLSDYLVNKSGNFYGADFSWGDYTINEKGKGEGGTGNATTWRQIGTNHHLAVVADQLSAISPVF